MEKSKETLEQAIERWANIALRKYLEQYPYPQGALIAQTAMWNKAFLQQYKANFADGIKYIHESMVVDHTMIDVLKKHALFANSTDEHPSPVEEINEMMTAPEMKFVLAAMDEYGRQCFVAGQETRPFNPDDFAFGTIPKYETYKDYLKSLEDEDSTNPERESSILSERSQRQKESGYPDDKVTQ